MEKKNEDYKNFANNKSILKIIQLETLLFSDSIIKMNDFGFSMDRIVIITNNAIYNLKDMVLKRKILLSNVIGITISNVTPEEFIIHGKDQEYDMHYASDKRKKIIEAIYQAYKQSLHDLLLLCQVDDYSLRSYVTSRREKKKNGNFSRMPLEFNTISIKNYLNLNDSNPNQPLGGEKDGTELVTRGTYTEPDEDADVNSNEFEKENTSIDNFKLLKVLKRTNHSKVVLAEFLSDKQYYVLKIFRKDKIIDNDTIDNVELEKQIMTMAKSPFICPIKKYFQTNERIYFALPYITGGELYSYMNLNRILTEETAKFYAAQIAMALQDLHDLGIIYRDLKPENLLIESSGYLRLIDCGFCKFIQGDEKAMSFCGTPEFLAPEMITGEGHNKACDWWSFGVLLYEMLFGIEPFYSRNREQMYEMIKTSMLKFPKKVEVSIEAKNIMAKLLTKDPAHRLGLAKGLDEIKAEPFFAGLDFVKLRKKEAHKFYKPEIKNGLNFGFNKEDEEECADSDIDDKTKMKIRMNEEQFECIDKISKLITLKRDNTMQ